MMKRWLWLLAIAACGGGGSSDTTLQISNYYTFCSQDSDCAAVFIGDPCTNACKCANAAINNTDTIRQGSDLAAAEALCTSMVSPCTAACLSPQVTCAQGTCALK
jgi:hypothetical protein